MDLRPSQHQTAWMAFLASALLSCKKSETAGKSIDVEEPFYTQ